MTVTYTNNNYVSSNDFAFQCTRVGKSYAFSSSVWLTNPIPISADAVEIGRISNYNAAKMIRVQIPNGSNTLGFAISDTGIIQIWAITNSVASGWYRFAGTSVVWN